MATIGSAPSAMADHWWSDSPQRDCLQAVTAGGGGAYLEAAGAKAVAGGPCRFTASADGGYYATAQWWWVQVTSPNGERRIYGSYWGHPPCADLVVHAGDSVEIESDGAIAAGADAGCAK